MRYNVSMNKKAVVLDAELADRLARDISDLMHHWHPDPYAADYRCELCNRTANTNRGTVTHAESCPGQQYLKALSTCFACIGTGREPDYVPEGRVCIWCEGSGHYR